MKGLAPLFLGIFGTFAFSWMGLTMIPNAQIGHLDPQTDEEGTDVYPAPRSGLAERGRQVYTANGCFYCHSQQVRADYAGSDIARKWGTRRSAPRDYIFDRPVLLGSMRMGPDLSNVGKRAPVEDAEAPAPDATTPTAGAALPAGASPIPAAGAPAPGASPALAAAAAPPAGAASPAPTGAQPLAPDGKPVPPALSGAGGLQPVPLPAGGDAAPSAPSPAPATAAQTADATAAPPPGSPLGERTTPLPYSAAWHHQHLYDPRSINGYSNMPAFRFLYEKRRISGERAANALQLTEAGAPGEGWEIVPTYEAEALVAYLMSLDQSHELKEVKAPAAAAPPAPASPPAPGNVVK